MQELTFNHKKTTTSMTSKLCRPNRCTPVSEINECEVIPNLCLNGNCINTEGSFTCACNQGYVYDPKLLYCVDQDECIFQPCDETAVCRNEPGTFRCVCPSGFVMDEIEFSCSGMINLYSYSTILFETVYEYIHMGGLRTNNVHLNIYYRY